MKKVVNIWYEEDREKRLGHGFGTGLCYEQEDENEAKNREWTKTTKVHATDKNIWWWRK